MINKKTLLALSMAIVLALVAIVLPAASVFGAAGSITGLSPSSGIVGTAVSLSGTGYTLGGNFSIYFDGINVGSGVVALPAGTVNAIFYVPAASRGNHNVTVNDSGGDTTLSAASFNVNPNINLSTTSGYVGDPLTISGNGFSASQTIYLYIDGVSITSVPSDANGSFAGTIVTIPPSPRGTHSIYGNDGIGPSLSYTYAVSPKLIISPNSGPVGSQLTLTGTGFTANSAITFLVDGAVASAPAVSTNTSGSFTLSNFTIPATSYGSHTIIAQDAGGGSGAANFTASQTMNINPQTGAAGTSVTVTGSGFGANKNIAITYQGVNALTNPPTVVADASGNFNVTMIVPPSGGGVHPIVASDGTISSSANFTIVGTANMTGVNRGAVGTSTTISGSGFTAGGNVLIKWDLVQLSSVTADAGGVFSAIIKVPPSKSGEHKVTVTDGINTKEFVFTVTSSASLEQTSGYIGSDVKITGSGFNGGATVTVSYDAAKVTTVTVDASGNFTTLFKAPVSKGGNHLITATDGSNTFTATFAMDSTPPPAPFPISPIDKAKADPQPDFIWAGVTDPSGVTYSFQLATDASFNAILVDKKDLSNSGYKVTEKEKLPSRSAQQPYYWRVKATDGASNESDWSSPYTFSVGFIVPGWAIYAIAGVAVVIFFLLGFWLGKRAGAGGGDDIMGN